jgi:flagellar basal-body rod protein FlgB
MSVDSGALVVKNLIGDKNFTLLKSSLKLTQQEQEVHSWNISNYDTPNYRYKKLNFQASLQEAMRQGTADAYTAIRGYVERPRDTVVRNNGNNVDIDQEMYDLQENKQKHALFLTVYNKKSQLLDLAIQGGR